MHVLNAMFQIWVTLFLCLSCC